jgi:hypothetical protein
MKQARQAVGGARRREGTKPCGRNTTSGLGSHWSYVAPHRPRYAGGAQTSGGVADEQTWFRPGLRESHGVALVILCRGAKACERISQRLNSRWEGVVS